jgi:hypothetical protein
MCIQSVLYVLYCIVTSSVLTNPLNLKIATEILLLKLETADKHSLYSTLLNLKITVSIIK